MSRRHIGEFDDELLYYGHENFTDPAAAIFRPNVFDAMRDQGYPIDEIHELKPVISEKDDEDTAYLVFKITTLTYPFEHPKCDALDKTTMWACTCKGWWYHHNSEFPADAAPSDVSDCPHTRLAKPKAERAAEDENQQQLASQ